MVPNPLDSIFAPFINADKLRINNRQKDDISDPGEIYNDNNKISKHNVYKKFFDSQWNNSLTPDLEDLARFIPRQLSVVGTDTHPLGKDKFNNAFDYLTLARTPHIVNGSRMDFYDMEAGPKSDEQAIRISPYDPPGNPIITLIHEGTHALDDAYMRTYQKEAIDILANMEPKDRMERQKWFDEGNWYNQAQNILGIEDFKTYYPYNGINNAKTNIENSFANLTKDYSTDESNTQENEEVTDFQKAKKAFEWLAEHKPGDAPDSRHFYASLGEFPAFAVQNINTPWQISDNRDDINYWKNNNDGRRFLKAITKGVYRNFRELDPAFSESYPDANRAFLDRLTQLRNYDKDRGKTEEQYRQYLINKFPQENPHAQVSPTASPHNQNINPITRQISPTPDYAATASAFVEYQNEPEVDPATYYSAPTEPAPYSDYGNEYNPTPRGMSDYYPRTPSPGEY